MIEKHESYGFLWKYDTINPGINHHYPVIIPIKKLPFGVIPYFQINPYLKLPNQKKFGTGRTPQCRHLSDRRPNAKPLTVWMEEDHEIEPAKMVIHRQNCRVYEELTSNKVEIQARWRFKSIENGGFDQYKMTTIFWSENTWILHDLTLKTGPFGTSNVRRCFLNLGWPHFWPQMVGHF